MGPGADAPTGAWPPTIEGVNAWLRGPGGRTRIGHTVDRYRLPPALADDLVQEVLYRAWRAIRGDEAVVSAPAFATTLLTRAAVDLLRGRAPREEAPERPGAPSGPLADADAGTERESGTVAGAAPGAGPVGDAVPVALDAPLADDMRRSLHGLLGPYPATGAAALAYVTLVADGVPPPSDCPAPEAGVDPEEGRAWAALWCSGRDDCFEAGPGGPADDPTGGQGAVRARRSQALRAMRALLSRAESGLPEDDRA
jgi:hypothetical protein